MIRKRLVHREQNIFRRRVCEICIRCGRRELRNHRLQLPADRARVVHKKSSVLRVHRMERQSQQSRLAPARKSAPPRYIQKRTRGSRSVALNDLDPPALLHHKQSAASIIRLLDIFRICESRRHRHQVKCRIRCRCRSRRGRGAGVVSPAASALPGEDQQHAQDRNKKFTR